MKRLLFPVALFALVVASAAAQAPLPAKMRPAKPAERQAAVSSIQAQLKAFGRDDYKTAVTYQSTGLKKNFPSPDAFRAMMMRTYPEFAHYKSVTFGPAQSDPMGTHMAILAAVTGQNGVTRRAVYLMVREGKIYRVEGVAGGAQMPLESNGPSKDV
jgi:hypothetical protein